MKRLIKTVDLRFFQDDATGDYGLCHKDTQDDRYGNAFNAFWNGIGLFHDVFEHSHEFTNKYFRGDYALNVGGEMTAMGAMWYYYNVLGVYNRMDSNRMVTPADSMKHTTLDEVQEAIGGYPRYGRALESNVPKQSPVYDSELEYQIQDFWKQVKEYNRFSEYEREKQDGIYYKQSVTFRKIADLHRYGFRMAEKLVADKWDNAQTLVAFIMFWDNFCKEHDAQEMAGMFSGLIVKVYRDETGLISWKAIFETADRFQFQDVTITENSHFAMEDAWIIEEQEEEN